MLAPVFPNQFVSFEMNIHVNYQKYRLIFSDALAEKLS